MAKPPATPLETDAAGLEPLLGDDVEAPEVTLPATVATRTVQAITLLVDEPGRVIRPPALLELPDLRVSEVRRRPDDDELEVYGRPLARPTSGRRYCVRVPTNGTVTVLASPTELAELRAALAECIPGPDPHAVVTTDGRLLLTVDGWGIEL